MEIGTDFISGHLYYTKNGVGKVIPFNEGWDFTNKKSVVIGIRETHTANVFCSGSISRHIKDIESDQEKAKLIKY